MKILRYGGIGLGFLLVLTSALVLTYHGKSTPAPDPVGQPVVLSIASLLKTLSRNVQTNTPGLVLAATPDQANIIGYTVPGHSFETLLPVDSSSVTLQDKQAETEAATYKSLSSAVPSIEQYFMQQAYTQVDSTGQADTFLSKVLFYQNSDNLCQVTVYSLLDVTCVPRSKLVADATQLDPFVALYAAAAPDAGMKTVAFPLLTASQTSGYSLATVSIHSGVGETAVNYYRIGTGGWQMINLLWYNDPHQNASITPNCEYFESNIDTYKAYAGHACYDSVTRVARSIR